MSRRSSLRRPRCKAPTIPRRMRQVLAQWKHEPGGAVNRLLSNGKVNDGAGNNTWSFTDDKLIFHWQPPKKTPGGFWVDTCNIAPDGLSYSGMNQKKTRVSGNLVKE